MRWIRTVATLAALAALASCGPSIPAPPQPTAPPAAPPPPAIAPLDRAKVVCEHAVRCSAIGASQLGECEAASSRLTLVWGYPDLLGIDAVVAAGRLRSTPGGAARCLAKLASASCRELTTSACDVVDERLLPNVAPGGACTGSNECIDGFCTNQPGCSGTCVAKHPIGSTCGSNQLCTDDAFCREGTCLARAGAGAPCGDVWNGCAEGLFCAGFNKGIDDPHYMSPGRLGTCHAPLDVGESCVADGGEHCRRGLYCAWGDAAPTCRAPLPSGATCRDADACADGLECIGLTLHGVVQGHTHFSVARAGTCEPTLDAGAACDPTAFTTGCPQAMRCDPATKRCASHGHAGDACESSWITKPMPSDEPLVNNGCFSSHYCDVATRTCKQQLSLGARCAPQTFGVEDEPCFLGKCDPTSHRCVGRCA